MATLKEYFETDFSHTLRVDVIKRIEELDIPGRFMFDYDSGTTFVSFYVNVSEARFSYELCQKLLLDIITNPEAHVGEVTTLPSFKTFHGFLEFSTMNGYEIFFRSYGEKKAKAMRDLARSKRIYIYSEHNLNDTEISSLYDFAHSKGFDLQFKSHAYRNERNKFETPLGFISHDSRDKKDIAFPIAQNLLRLQCPVWYDEFSLNLGDSLRESIEKGIRECTKCILVISPNFLSNSGWTKAEFNSIFTREMIQKKNFILPVWYNVNVNDVYEYSTSLADRLAVNWNEGEDAVIKKLYKAITDL